jgi:hypothetical protein
MALLSMKETSLNKVERERKRSGRTGLNEGATGEEELARTQKRALSGPFGGSKPLDKAMLQEALVTLAACGPFWP